MAARYAALAAAGAGARCRPFRVLAERLHHLGAASSPAASSRYGGYRPRADDQPGADLLDEATEGLAPKIAALIWDDTQIRQRRHRHADRRSPQVSEHADRLLVLQGPGRAASSATNCAMGPNWPATPPLTLFDRLRTADSDTTPRRERAPPARFNFAAHLIERTRSAAHMAFVDDHGAELRRTVRAWCRVAAGLRVPGIRQQERVGSDARQQPLAAAFLGAMYAGLVLVAV